MAHDEQTDAAEKAYAAAASEKATSRKGSADDAGRAGKAAEEQPASAPKSVPVVAESKKAEPKPARKATASVAAKPAPRNPGPQTPTTPSTFISKLKDRKMATTTIENTAAEAQNTADDFAARIQDAVKNAEDRARTALEQGKSLFDDAGEFTRGNIEAMVESGKILADGFQALGKTYVETAKANFAAVQTDVQELTSVKSLAEFVKLQSELVRKYIDTAVENNAKSTEAVVKLASEAIKPISNRVNFVVEKVKQAA